MLESSLFMRSSLLKLLFITSFIGCAGCSWLGHKPAVSLEEETNPYLSSGKIINKDLLKKGGKLVVIPFKAGPGVEENDQLDKIALMIVKGIADELGSSGSLEVVTGDKAKDADFILEGHVTSLGRTAKLKRWTTFQDKTELAVKGRISAVKTKEMVAVFSDDRQSKYKGETQQQLGLMLGQDIGKFISSGIE